MTRLLNAWGALGRDQRLAAAISLGLFVSMLLPWYSKTNTVVVRDAAHATEQSLSAFQAFSFVEAAVLLVSVGVLAMLFARAERRDFQLPGGDGTIVMIAGAWVAILIFYRLFDKPGLQGNQRIVSTVGVQWGIFLALLLALGLAYVGRRIRTGERGAPPLKRRPRPGPGSVDPTAGGSAPEPDEVQTQVGRAPAHSEEATTIAIEESRRSGSPARREPRWQRPRFPPSPSSSPSPSQQLSFEEEPPETD